MFNSTFAQISFGRRAIESFNVNKTTAIGTTKKVPVTVYKLDAKDLKDTFCFEKTKDICVGNYFREHAKADDKHKSYIIEKDKNGKLLGAAECTKDRGNIYLTMIGTSKNPKYKGLGRALLAGIAKDTKGEFPEIRLHSIVEGTSRFYQKCHFDYYKSDGCYCLDDINFDKLISDAKKNG